MLSKDSIKFLDDLRANNNREWFQNNKKRLNEISLTDLTIYDIDQDEKIQFSQGLALGIAFKRGNFPEKK